MVGSKTHLLDAVGVDASHPDALAAGGLTVPSTFTPGMPAATL